MKFEHSVKEETQTIKRRDDFHGEVGGYDVLFKWDNDGGAELTIYGSRSQGHVGMVNLRPKTLGELEDFAACASVILPEIIQAIKDNGFTDLRSKWDKMHEETDAMIAQMRLKRIEEMASDQPTTIKTRPRTVEQREG